MRISRFYFADDLHPGQILSLPPGLFRHAIQVLRMKAGDQLILFNGRGGEYTAELKAVSKREASASIQSFNPVNRESTLHLTLVQSIIKPDKMDMAIQKSVELGVSVIQPIISQRGVVRMGRNKLDKKLEHWQAVAIAACEQSGRTGIPDVLAPQEISEWLVAPAISATANDIRLMLMPGDYPRIHTLQGQLTDGPRISLMIGPEGGFTHEEVALCKDNGVRMISLGPRILRAETAALSVTTLLQQYFGDL